MGNGTLLHKRIQASLASRESRQMLRSLTPKFINNSNSPLVDFSSNDYLSLSKSDELSSRYKNRLLKEDFSPYGPASSRLLDGNTPAHMKLESLLIDFFNDGNGQGLLFNSGFDANVGIWSCLPGDKDVIIYDELVHASTHDGMRKGRCKKSLAFKHGDVQDFEKVILGLKDNVLNNDVVDDDGNGNGNGNGKIDDVWIAIEALYSMDGDICPLEEMVQVIDKHLPPSRVHIVLDEAHASGIYGPKGRGLAYATNLTDRIRIRLHTFGKALSCAGGIVLCDSDIRSFMINYSRPLIYSSALPHINILAISESVNYLQDGSADNAIKHLHHLTITLNKLLQDLIHEIPTTSLRLFQQISTTTTTRNNNTTKNKNKLPPSPIIPILTNSPRKLSSHLIESGFLIRPITYPTVPKGLERVRICIHAGNTIEDIHGLIYALRNWIINSENGNEKAKAKANAKL